MKAKVSKTFRGRVAAAHNLAEYDLMVVLYKNLYNWVAYTDPLFVDVLRDALTKTTGLPVSVYGWASADHLTPPQNRKVCALEADWQMGYGSIVIVD